MSLPEQRNIREMNSHYKEEREAIMQRQFKKRKGFYRRLGLLGVFVVIVFSLTFLSLHSKNRALGEKQETKERLETKLAQLQLEEQNLVDEIEKLNDLEYIAEVARRDYFLTKPGEIIFKLPAQSAD